MKIKAGDWLKTIDEFNIEYYVRFSHFLDDKVFWADVFAEIHDSDLHPHGWFNISEITKVFKRRPPILIKMIKKWSNIHGNLVIHKQT